MSDLLTVEGLAVHFFTRVRCRAGGRWRRFRRSAPRETLGIVGESGSGKTVASLAVLRLVPPPARIVGGSMLFEDRDLLALDEAAMRGLRGKRIAMIFQNPANSLNPILTIGDQLTEILRWHERNLAPPRRATASAELLRAGRHHRSVAAAAAVPARAVAAA